MPRLSLALPLAATTAVASQTLASQTLASPALAQPTALEPRVGPPRGAVVVVGGGSIGPDVYARFIELAGGPDALIVDVPTAGGDSTYTPDSRGARGLRAAGARNVLVLHTADRRLADTERFAAPLARAGGVWFEGGRQWRLVDAYAGTRTERAFHDVLARGGVVGGTSAGASILASYLVRGAPSGNTIMMAPGYEAGFGFLRGTAIDQHVVARERLPDLADSVMPRRPELLGLSEDEGTAWVIRGDTAEVVGRGLAFVYGGGDATDPGAPFLTLRAGDRYDLGTRRVMSRAIDGNALTAAFVDSVVAAAAPGRAATVHVALRGRVLVAKSYGVPAAPRHMPTTTVPSFPLGRVGDVVHAVVARSLASDRRLSLEDTLPGGATLRRHFARARGEDRADSRLASLLAARGGAPYPRLVDRRVLAPIGAHRTTVSPDGAVASNVDELYRLALGLEHAGRAFASDTIRGTVPPLGDDALGWRVERPRGPRWLAAYGTDDGRRHAFLRVPDRRLTVILLTDGDEVDARAAASRIADRALR